MTNFIFPMVQLFSIHMRLSTSEVMVVRVYERGPMADGLIPYSADVTIKYVRDSVRQHEEFIFNQLHGAMAWEYEGDNEGQKDWVLLHIIGMNEDELPHKHLSLQQQKFLNDYTSVILRSVRSIH